jgi:hypothetical protein
MLQPLSDNGKYKEERKKLLPNWEGNCGNIKRSDILPVDLYKVIMTLEDVKGGRVGEDKNMS